MFLIIGFISINLISDTFCLPPNNDGSPIPTNIPFTGEFTEFARVARGGNSMDDMILGGYDNKGGACHRETQFGYLPSLNPSLECFKVGLSYDDFTNVGDFIPYGMAIDLTENYNLYSGSSQYTTYYYDFSKALAPGVKIELDFAFQFDCDLYPDAGACKNFMNWFTNFEASSYIAFYDSDGNVIDSGFDKYNPVKQSVVSNNIVFTYDYRDGSNFSYVSNLGTLFFHIEVELPEYAHRVALTSYDGSNAQNQVFSQRLINVFYPKMSVDMSGYELKAFKMQNMNFIMTGLPEQGSVFFKQCYKKQNGNITNITFNPMDTNGAFYYWNGSTDDFSYKGISPITYNLLQSPFPDIEYSYHINYDLQNKHKGLIFLSVYSVGQPIENPNESICIANGFWDKLQCGTRTVFNKVLGFITNGSLGTQKYDEDFIDAKDYYCEFYLPINSYSSELIPNYGDDYVINSYDFDYLDENGNLKNVEDAFASKYRDLNLDKNFLTPFNENFIILNDHVNYTYNHLDLSFQHFLIAFLTIFIFVIVGRKFFK